MRREVEEWRGRNNGEVYGHKRLSWECCAMTARGQTHQAGHSCTKAPVFRAMSKPLRGGKQGPGEGQTVKEVGAGKKLRRTSTRDPEVLIDPDSVSSVEVFCSYVSL